MMQLKKEYCRVGINDEGNLTIAIENKLSVHLQRINPKEEGVYLHFLNLLPLIA